MDQLIQKTEFKNYSPKDVLEATYLATKNFQIRALFEAKKEILEIGKYTEQEFYHILDAMIDGETERQLFLQDLRKIKEVLKLDDLVRKFSNLNPMHLLRDIIYLKEQGYIEESNEVKIKLVKKKIKGVEKEVEQEEHIFKYKANKLDADFVERFFEPVSIIYNSGLCCNCGWCSAICPVNAIVVNSDELKVDEELCIKCGLCFTVCPRSFPIERVREFKSQLNESLTFSEKIGTYLNTYSGTTNIDQIKKSCQDGGIVTTLLEYLLKNKVVDAIIAVKHSEDLWNPKAVIVNNLKDLYKTAGTKYANCASLSILDQSKQYEGIAIVGVPCMMKAIEKGSLFPSGYPFFTNIKYKIGLFCMESFSYDNNIKLVEEKFDKNIEDLVKMNIDKGKFIINLKSGEELDVPLKEIQAYARETCHFCEDLTSDFADISVGSIGSQAGWSSVITRNEKGEELYQAAIKDGLIESKELTEVKPGRFLVEKIAGIKRNKCKPIKLTENK
jgi:coenzyme F420 hydrogenase subunit beta